MILATVYVGLLVCAAVFAVLSPALVIPPLAAFAAISNLNPTDHLERLMDHIWAKCEEKLSMKTELVNTMMLARNRITMEDLEGIRLVIQELQEKIQGFSSLSIVDIVKDPVVRSMIKDVERKIVEFARAVKDLQTERDKCYKDVMSAKKKMMGMT